MRRVEDVEALGAERAAHHLGRERRAAHAEHDDVVDRARRDHLVRELEHLVQLLQHPLRLVEPAEPLRLVGAGPDGRVARPDPLDDIRASTVTRRRAVALLGDPLRELVERVDELLHAFALERVGHVVVVDAGLARCRPAAASPCRARARACPRPCRDPGTPGSSPRASCSPCRGPISSSTYMTSRYAGFFVEVDAQRHRCGCAPFAARRSQRSPENSRL